MTINYTALERIPYELCSRQLVKLDLAHNLLVALPSAIWRLSALSELSLEDNLLTSLDPIDPEQTATADAKSEAAESGGLANLKILNLSRNRLAACEGLEMLESLKLVELRFRPQQMEVEPGLADAVESVPQDDGRTLREYRLRQQPPPDEDNDDIASEQQPVYETDDDAERGAEAAIVARARQDPLTPPITAIIAKAVAEPSPAPSHRPHSKQEEVGKRVFEVIEKRLLEQMGGASGASLGERFDDFELSIAVPELNSLFNQTEERLENFARYYLSTRGRHLYTGVSGDQLLPDGAVFKVGTRSPAKARLPSSRGASAHPSEPRLPRDVPLQIANSDIGAKPFESTLNRIRVRSAHRAGRSPRSTRAH